LPVGVNADRLVLMLVLVLVFMLVIAVDRRDLSAPAEYVSTGYTLCG